ncbi:MAG: hypothetical protein ACREVR_06465 [Burkholderiales bacterium]
MIRWLVLVIVLVAGWYWWPAPEIKRTPGAVAAGAPAQQELRAPAPGLSKAGYEIRPLASFELEARVLGVERYRSDRGADLAPVDLALGWGRMSDTAVLERISITQSGRFYFWHTPQYPIPRREIETSSANMHMIPANDAVARRLDEVRRGHVVRLSGYLIEARGADGWRWRSSLTREDTGNGSCELVWVERLELR